MLRSRPIGPADDQKWASTYGVDFDRELLTRYDFTLAGASMLNGRNTFEIAFQPKNPPVARHHILNRLLNHAAGTLWVDEEDYEIVKAQVELSEPISVAMLGAINKLSFRFERSRSPDGSWLTRSTEAFFRGRRLLTPAQFRQAIVYSDYRKSEPNQVGLPTSCAF